MENKQDAPNILCAPLLLLGLHEFGLQIETCWSKEKRRKTVIRHSPDASGDAVCILLCTRVLR